MANPVTDKWNIAITESIEWAKSLKMERATSTSLHKVQQALAAGELIYHPDETAAEAQSYYDGVLKFDYHAFVLEHDWAAAFEGAHDYDGPPDVWDFRTPFDNCAWEFRISGHRVLFFTRFVQGEGEGTIAYRASAVIETAAGWIGLPLSIDRNKEVASLLFKQVRAVCISLDAEVSRTEIVRAPHRLNAARERRGDLPLPDYSVVNLARRSGRPEPLPESGDEHRRTIRLHFRRGHWRHFEAHKTWIKWTLVSDPDLGFIEKHYRL